MYEFKSRTLPECEGLEKKKGPSTRHAKKTPVLRYVGPDAAFVSFHFDEANTAH